MELRARDVMVTPVRSVEPDLRLDELERLLIAERISGAAVVQGGRLLGIVSRSDLVRSRVLERARAEVLSAYYLDPFDVEEREEDSEVDEAVAKRLHEQRVEDVMVRALICVGPDAGLQEVARSMLERRIHRLLVTEEERLLGVISSLDLVRLFAEGRV